MANVIDILRMKGGSVQSATETMNVLDATRRMNEARIGALVVLDMNGQVTGMFTERDVLRRVVSEERNPVSTTLAQVMTTEVVCCNPDTDLEEVRSLMMQRRIRHLPVVDRAGHLEGMISIGDVNAHFASKAEVQIHYLNEMIYGRA